MKLAIVNLTSGYLSGGFRKYLQKVVPLLSSNPCISQVNVFIPPQTKYLDSLESNHLLSWPITDHRFGFFRLRSKIRQLSPDVVFIPTARWLDCGQIPVISMVRNMEPLITPFAGNPWKEGIKNIGRAYIAKKACQRSTRVIAVSQYVKDFLYKQWNIDSNKIGVIYHGVEEPPDRRNLLAPTWAQNQEQSDFILTAGSIRPARGLEDLIHAFGELNARGLNYKLVIAGAIDPLMGNYKNKLESLSLKLDIASKIIWAGHLAAEEMSWCYYNCAAFVMTSRAEACPNIALEAMAHGCVCISTDAAPMPEFFQDAGAYYHSNNGKTLSNVIQTAISWDKNRKKTMVDRARQRAAQFSWDLTAEKTIEELKKVL